MRSTGWLVACSLTMCVAVWLGATGWAQPRPRLTVAMRRLHRIPDTGADDPRPTVRVGRRIEPHAARWTHRWSRPLRLVGRSVPEHLGMLALAALVGLVTPSLVLGALQVSGVVELWVWVPAAVSIGTAALAAWVVHSDTMARSADVAVDLRHQLGAYLDMVSMLLAGNSGYEGALEQAARAGDGLLFRELRRRMREVATTGDSLVAALELVAEDYGVVELEQVAATARLSANEGAPIARTLNAKCATVRSTLAAEQEADARVRTDKVTPPLVGMALLFMALIIYPALDLT